MKTILISLLLLSTLLRSQIDDKTKHVYAGMLITIVSAEITNQVINDPFKSTLIGLSTGLTAGLIKDVVYDKMMKKGIYDKNDILATSWGAACGAIIIRVKFDLCDKRKEKELYKLISQKQILD